MLRILIVDDEERFAKLISAALEKDGHIVDYAVSGSEALGRIEINPPDILIPDLRMEPMDGLSLLKEVKANHPETEIILMTAYATVETAVEAMKEGARDYIIKPFKIEELKMLVSNMTEMISLRQENRLLKESIIEKVSFDNIIGASGAMQEVFRMIEKVAPSDTTVLLRGESGTGKELLAEAVHYHSPRKKSPLIKVNCGALPETLLESELFGHVKGSFTGAIKDKPGRFELADNGTIFLDEIGDISPAIQVKLLRVLQEKEFQQVGGTKTLKCRARVIAATNRHLEELMDTGEFRSDLYYRLNVFPITIPPLRDRSEDILNLLDHFLKKLEHPSEKISDYAVSILQSYSWPGNVRELENVLERAKILAGDGIITEEHLPPALKQAGQKEEPDEETSLSRKSLDKTEELMIRKALEEAGGNKSKAARILGITRRRLYSKMEKHGIE